MNPYHQPVKNLLCFKIAYVEKILVAGKDFRGASRLIRMIYFSR